jgi:acyl-CoA reductase-like NAD-dependent aldehyde dehydrogenase
MRSIEEVPELADVLRYVVGGPDTGQAIVGEIDALCFTGSVPTGRALAEVCARRLIPAFLELGGNDAAVVTATADLKRAAAAVLRGGVHNTGQQCFATERVYVQAEAHDAFVDELIRQASALELNYPDIHHGDIGPFILGRQADIVDRHLADALARGARLECGGPSEVLGGGRYMRPTVLTGVNHEMALMTEETFGPVIPVMAYDTADEAVGLANDTDFGLSGSVIAGDIAEAEAIGERLNAGAISIQDTGLHTYILRDVEKMAYGISGLGGSRMGPNGLLRFLRRKALIRLSGEVIEMRSLSEQNRAVGPTTAGSSQ